MKKDLKTHQKNVKNRFRHRSVKMQSRIKRVRLYLSARGHQKATGHVFEWCCGRFVENVGSKKLIRLLIMFAATIVRVQIDLAKFVDRRQVE